MGGASAGAARRVWARSVRSRRLETVNFIRVTFRTSMIQVILRESRTTEGSAWC
jgi:hypothetical protein